MKMLHLLLVLMLSVSVPVTTLAATMSMAQCEQMHSMTDNQPVDQGHAQHTGHPPGHDARTAMHGDSGSTVMAGHCDHCQTGHCASGCVSALASGELFLSPNLSAHAELIVSSGGHTALAHSLDLLRPPA